MSQYFSENCPFCNKLNLWSVPEKFDIEAIRCFSCKKEWLVPIGIDDIKLEDANIENGTEKI